MELISGYFKTGDGVSLHSLEAGSGDILLFIPGWSQTARLFEILLKDLAIDYKVIALDMRGHGESERPEHGYRPSRFAADIHEFIEDRKLNNITLIGHSMGCAAIWSFLELFGDKNIRKIVLIDQAPSVVAWPSWSEEEKNLCGSLHTPESLFNTLSLLTSSESSHMRESYIRDCLLTKNCPSDIADWVLFENMKFPALYAARLLMEGSTQDWRDIIRQITLPTLIFGGKASIFNPLSQIWISQQIENSTIHIFEESEGGSHFMWLENPKKFLKLLREFLTKKDI